MKEKIFVQIASYRDPELLPTLKNLLETSDSPQNLVICIAWQHSSDDQWDNLDSYKSDKRFKIIDIDYKDSKGTCWARNKIQQYYNDEEYTLQLDSHHRFIKGWDTELKNMYLQLQKEGYKKPLLTSYIPSYNPENDPEERVNTPWWMTFDKFIPEGAVFFLPSPIPNWEKMDRPIPSRFYSAHFAFTIGKFCKEVPHDPHMYFHGEEISIAVRAYTQGYDLFHPHKVIAWHEYTRKGRTKHWDDDKNWVDKNTNSHKRNRILFGMEDGCNSCMRKSLSSYDFGKERTLEDYERYSGINFKKRSVQKYTKDNNFAPNPPLYGNEFENSFLQRVSHQIEIDKNYFDKNDYEFVAVIFRDSNNEEIFRDDLSKQQIDSQLRNDTKNIEINKTFFSERDVSGYVIWPYSKEFGWCDKIEGVI